MSGTELTIGVLLPDVLGTYSDAGNALVLAARARSRGVDVHIVSIHADDTPPAGCELYLLGGGEDAAQAAAIDWLSGHRALRRALAGPAVTFAVCAGLQILGVTLTDVQGRCRDGLGLLDLTTVPGTRRAVGEVVTRCELPGVGLITGFENHRGSTTLGTTCPLGRVVSGTGNGGPHRSGAVEGARSGNVIATYLHGPVLARNPALADHILERATGCTFSPADAPAIPDLPELRRHYLSAGPARRRPPAPRDPAMSSARRRADRPLINLSSTPTHAADRGRRLRPRLILLSLLATAAVAVIVLALAGIRQ